MEKKAETRKKLKQKLPLKAKDITHKAHGNVNTHFVTFFNNFCNNRIGIIKLKISCIDKKYRCLLKNGFSIKRFLFGKSF